MTPQEKIIQKTLVTSGLNSAQWNEVQAGLRDRAFFSSRVESAKFLHSARAQIADMAGGGRSPSEIRRDLRKLLDDEGYTAAAEDEGTIKDLRSKARLDVLIQTNARQARGYMQQLEGNTPGALAAFPGQELLRTRNSKVQRDWSTRWQGAGGRMHGGRMVALKTDSVWVKLSRFGVPWPPFDFGSGMGVQDLSKAEALALGLIRADDPPPVPAVLPGFNDKLEADVPFAGTEDPQWNWLKDSFGDQVVYNEGKVKWKAELIKEALKGDGAPGAVVRLGKVTADALAKADEAGIRELLENKSFSPDRTWLRDHITKHMGDKERDPDNVPLTAGDLDLLASIWRKPDEIKKSGKGSAEFLLEAFDGVIHLFFDLHDGLVPSTLYKTKSP